MTCCVKYSNYWNYVNISQIRPKSSYIAKDPETSLQEKVIQILWSCNEGQVTLHVLGDIITVMSWIFKGPNDFLKIVAKDAETSLQLFFSVHCLTLLTILLLFYQINKIIDIIILWLILTLAAFCSPEWKGEMWLPFVLSWQIACYTKHAIKGNLRSNFLTCFLA